MNKRIPKGGYRVLAIVWTLAAASIAVALVRRLPMLNLLLLALLILSVIAAASYWKCYHAAPETNRDPFPTPPRFKDNPVLFDDLPQTHTSPSPNQDSEENDNER